MGLNQDCRSCIIKRQQERVKHTEAAVRDAYLEKVEACVAAYGDEESAPVITDRISKLHEEFFHERYSFAELKKKYNGIMLLKEAEIREEIQSASDPLKLALLYARAGNYIDFGALASVEDEKLKMILERCQGEVLDEQVYKAFIESCKAAKKLVYLTDNCGEIVMDKLLIEQIRKQFPQCGITVIVRGEEVLNDATYEDAKEVGLDRLVSVVGNGTGIAGTSLPHISKEAKALLEQADCIVSKGQGNFETLSYCGLNIFYLFLCKCQWFEKRFGMRQFEGVFVRDCDLR